jgi:Amt family ammonium transporter
MVTRVKRVLGYDDSLDAFGVHGIGGTLGCERETEGLDVALDSGRRHLGDVA